MGCVDPLNLKLHHYLYFVSIYLALYLLTCALVYEAEFWPLWENIIIGCVR